jgi:uncharacterized YccA/Bax inhibitor family protein
VQQLNDMYAAPSYAPPSARPMTIDDVVMRGFMTLGTLVVSAAAAWYLNLGWGIGAPAMLVGLVLGLIVSFKQSTNPALILGYALCYGIAIGVLSHMYEDRWSGIVLQAVLGTMLAFGGTLAVYALKVFRPTPKFTKFVIAAGFAALGLMLVNMIASIFVTGGLGLRADNPIGWIFSVAMILLGCFFLLLDFDEVERGVRAGVPEKYSWLMAFGLTLSLVWLYLEILRFISYFTSND